MATTQQLLALKSSIENYISALNKRVIVQDFGIVESDDELAQLQGLEQSFSEVFNTWMRFSRQYGASPLYTNSANVSELSTWSYNSGDNSIFNTTNSNTYIGFISPTKHDDYVFEVTVKSTDGDDDYIGLVLAYAVDEQGRGHTLDVLRHSAGLYPMVVCKNYSVEANGNGVILLPQDVPNPFFIGVTSGLTWVDGGVADGVTEKHNAGSSGGWVSAPNGCKIKATRQGDILTIETSQFNQTGYFAPATTVIDLSSDPRLEIFRGPCQFGYSAHSQASSTWIAHSRPGSREPILDIRTNTLHEWSGIEWQTTVLTDNLPSIVKSGRFYINPVSGKLFFADSRYGFKKVMEAI